MESLSADCLLRGGAVEYGMAARVHRSDDDHLFLVGGSNEVLRLYDSDGFDASVDVPAWRRRLAARDAFFRRLGIPWCQLLAPEKLSVYGDAVLRRLLGPGAVAPGQRLLDRVAHPALVYPADYLRLQRDKGYVVYPRTDSHWTALGALCAFQWIAPALGLHLDYAPFLELQPRRLCYHGDLWGDGHDGVPEDMFDRRVVPDSVARIHANPIVMLKERLGLENEMGLHIGSHVVYRNSAAQRPERVVLFGSSFSEYRADCSLLTFLAALFFREVHFVWSSALDLGFIERLAPDLALIEMPERFITACPDDAFDVEAYGAQAAQAWMAAHPG
ncbi:hypothetical protein [Limobrevibacterium gyesilva]|uniref:AlgX/AlgJ SGNH hydrolase-like domain-containing protein n=1 Tax=Limobrevibacterium gyesilva TaxID=2991712 RepID=A0AA42CIM9_9PROT|nr:hypothetical protein [Limobrevibacterium gyesilva]MCW3476087.1 hypothetical protein [Limobrevibacterium gyesilva]